ncbi:MAG: hypothetical protein AVDCRST_MAG41-2258 [uncultured Corynebacteriales bacterium]|uniref:Uncharacterized protein n=1 Tax=uncultured Mycobacteriales bacterium TaxID=581187 RepID=A0A6J4INV4_9ACTN|nr:MAG: hypothetical protein AVDCRST_MAG41-2258 [uncultured Corynebacteriales bacterium]
MRRRSYPPSSPVTQRIMLIIRGELGRQRERPPAQARR